MTFRQRLATLLLVLSSLYLLVFAVAMTCGCSSERKISVPPLAYKCKVLRVNPEYFCDCIRVMALVEIEGGSRRVLYVRGDSKYLPMDNEIWLVEEPEPSTSESAVKYVRLLHKE